MDDIAGETIKGISVVIGSDTTGLTAALADVNKASRGIQSELKQVERLLKLDPTNTELLAQRQQLLTDAVANTSEKLNRLRSAQEQVNEQFARGEITAGQYRAFQREIAATEQQLRRFEERASESVDSLNDLGDAAESNAEKLQNISDKVKGAGEKMTAGVTAPIAAAGGLMLKGAIDAENAQGKLQASLGITADAAADLEAVAQAVWVNGFGQNIEEANAAIDTVRKNMGILAEDDLQLVAQGAMTIAEVFEQDVNAVTASAGVAMKNFGIEGKEALDLITVGFQRGGDYSGELLDSFREYAPQFASMGISAEQAMGILIAGAKAGAFNLDKVGDSVKEFNLLATSGSKGVADAFTSIGLNANQMSQDIAKGGEEGQQAFMATVAALAAMKNPLEQNQAGVALFGTQWEDVRSKVIVAMTDGMKGIDDFKGATDEATAAMYNNNPGLAITKAMRELQLSIGPALLPLADIIKNTIVPAVKDMAEWFNNLSPAGQKAALAFAGIAVIIGPVLIALSALISTVGAIKGAFSAASLAINGAGGFGAVLTGTVLPIAGVIAVIAALAAAAYLIITNWEPIKEFFGNLWTSVVTTTTAAWEGLKQFFSDTWTAITTSVSSAWEGIKSAISDGLSAILEFLQPALTFYQTIFQNAWDIIKNVVLGAILIILDIVTGDFTQLGKDIQSIWDNIKTALGNIWNAIKDLAINAWESLKTSVISITTGIIEGAKNIWNDLLTWFKALPGQLQTIGSNMFTSMKNGVAKTITSVKTAIIDGIQVAIDWITELPSKMIGYGKDIIQGLIDGIKEMISDVERIVGDLADTIKRKIKGALGIHSPSKVMMEIGEFTGEGFIEGMRKTLSEISRQAEKMANAAIPDTSSITNGLNDNISVGNLSGGTKILKVDISNNGTLVGSNGMNEFADIMSRKIAGSFGFSTGGDF